MQLPYDRDTERVLLSKMMITPEGRSSVFEMLDAADFSSDSAQIFDAIKQLHLEGKEITPFSIHVILPAVPVSELIGIQSLSVTDADIDMYAQVVKEKSLKRQLALMLETHKKHATNGQDPFSIMASLFSELENLSNRKNETLKRDISSALERTLQQIQKGTEVIRTGLIDLDRLVMLSPGTVTTVAARPRVGKSLLLSTIAESVANETPVAFFSLEMTEIAIISRMISRHISRSVQEIMSGKIQAEDMTDAVEKILRKKIYLYAEPMSAMDIRLTVQSIKREVKNLKVVFVDYLQLVKASGEKYYSREQEVADVMRSMSHLAKNLGVCVILAAQLNRMSEQRPDRVPSLADLRESGSIEQDSDNVLLLHRPELFGQATLSDGTLSKNILEVRVAKNRNGPQGNIRLYFDGSRMLISNLQEAEKEELGELPF